MTSYNEIVVELMGDEHEAIIDSDDVISVFDDLDSGESVLPTGITFAQYTEVVMHFLGLIYDRLEEEEFGEEVE